MALSIYTGPPGSGKTYAIVSEVILPAWLAGRRIVTNVSGILQDNFLAYADKKNIDGPTGDIVVFDGLDSIKPGFWPAVEGDQSAFVQAGDLVVVDEVRLYWPPRSTFPEPIIKFFRLHRHFTRASDGQSTDIVLATQVLADVHRDVRGIAERSFRFKKLSSLGFSKSYVWNMWEGCSQRKGEAVANGTGKYKAELFALYQSYKGGSGLESQTDGRTVVWRNSRFLLLAVLSVALLAWAGFFLYNFFRSSPADDAVELSPAGAVAFHSEGIRAGGNSTALAPAAPPKFETSPYTIGGILERDGSRWVILATSSGEVRFESPSLCQFDAVGPVTCIIDGKRAWPSVMGASEQHGSSGIMGGVL